LNIRLLDRLRAVPGDYVPLCELGSNLEQIRGDLTSLVAFGFAIEQHPYRGASYVGPAQRLCPDQIEHELAVRCIGRRIVVWNRVTSTNDLANRAAESRSNNGLVILAEEQTAGRGRRGRSWTAPPQTSILMSVLLFPPRHLLPGDSAEWSGQAWLTALGAVAAAEVVAAWTGRIASIKWPNDVRVDGRKIAGILVERSRAPDRVPAAEPAWGAVIGIGLNANLTQQDFPPELAGLATSLQIEQGGARVDRSEVARDLIRRLDHWYDLSHRDGPGALSAAWRSRSEHLGRLVALSTPQSHVVGRLVDLDLRIGATLELGSTAGDPSRDGSRQPISGPSDSESSQNRRARGALAPRLSGGAFEDPPLRLATLPLADIRSIEPVHETQTVRHDQHG
jgi:BirA family transcriptional regulator, biotin operon repressor / biotin---[acetyl-CoA-carboxylase] ligase